MRPNRSKFNIYRESTKQSKYWANYADENVLLTTHAKVKPYVDLTDPVMKYMASAAPSLVGKKTPLQDFLKNSGRVRQVDGEWIRWKLRGTGEVQAVQMQNMNPGVACPGIQSSEFPINLDVEWFVEGDIIAPDVAKECQVVVEGLPMGDGSGFTYNVRIVDKDPDAYFPPELLESGLRWIKIDSAYSEASRGYGSTVFKGMSYIEFQSSFTDYGKQVEITNKAHDLNLRVQMCDENGKHLEEYPDQVISYIEAEFLAQAKWEKELRLYYGRSAGNQLIDKSVGYHRRIGPGLLEFLEDGNVIPYPVSGGSLDMFEEFLQSIWFDRVPPEQRNIVAYTGQGGLKLWRDWLADKYNIQPTFRNHKDFTKPAKSYDGKNYDGFKINTTQPTEASFFPFGSFRVEHWPILDSTALNGSVLHPETGLPLSSYEFIILDYGLGMGGGSNIELLEKRDSEVYTYKCGTWSPAGPINGRTGRNGFVSTGPNRSYTLFHTKTHGLRIKDVSLSAWLKPSSTF